MVARYTKEQAITPSGAGVVRLSFCLPPTAAPPYHIGAGARAI
jgi:hypothetical protein